MATVGAALCCLLGAGTASSGGPPAFEEVALPSARGECFTTVALGPEGRLYATAVDSQIWRWPIEADGTTGPAQVIDSLQSAEGGQRLLIGMAFDPLSTADNLVAWVSHTSYGFDGMPDWGGKISRLSGPDLGTVQEIVVGLPRSSRDHVTNGLAFAPDGLLHFLQGSNSAMGAPDADWDDRPERLLSAAVLRLEAALIDSPPLDARTEAGGSYDPYAPGAPLTIYASGVRNAYDLVWHTNGHLYVPTNGSSDGGSTPAGVPGEACQDGGTYSRPCGAGIERRR